MTDQEALNLTDNEFQREVLRRNSMIRGISTQVDNLTNQKSVLEKEISSLQGQLDIKHKEMDRIDEIFSTKMEEYQAHVDSVQSSLKKQEDELTVQRTEQSKKESDLKDKEIILNGRFNNIEASKDGIVQHLSSHLMDHSDSIKDVINAIREL